MPDFYEPIDWVDTQKIRARDLNRALFYTMGWLKDRPTDFVTTLPQAANKSITDLVWTKLEPAYQVSIVLPTVCNVLLMATGRILGAGANHRIWLDIIRDDTYSLSSTDGTPPAAADDGLLEMLGHTTTSENLNFFWWDINVPSGVHTWDIALAQASDTFSIIQTSTAWQLGAIAW